MWADQSGQGGYWGGGGSLKRQELRQSVSHSCTEQNEKTDAFWALKTDHMLVSDLLQLTVDTEENQADVSRYNTWNNMNI